MKKNKPKKQKKNKISFWSIMIKSIKEAHKSYKIYIQNELEKKALLSSRSDWSMLESLVQKCNDNPNLRISICLNDNTRIDMKTYDPHKTITSSLINGDDYEEIK